MFHCRRTEEIGVILARPTEISVGIPVVRGKCAVLYKTSVLACLTDGVLCLPALKGKNMNGFGVKYCPGRSRLKLRVSYYRHNKAPCEDVRPRTGQDRTYGLETNSVLRHNGPVWSMFTDRLDPTDRYAYASAKPSTACLVIIAVRWVTNS
jgi:hypothetical protein